MYVLQVFNVINGWQVKLEAIFDSDDDRYDAKKVETTKLKYYWERCPMGIMIFPKKFKKPSVNFSFLFNVFFFRSTLVTEGPYVAVPFIVRLVWHPMSGLTSRRLIRKLIMMLKKIRIPSFGPQMSGRPEKFCQYVNWQMDCVPRERRRLRERLCCYGRVQ